MKTFFFVFFAFLPFGLLAQLQKVEAAINGNNNIVKVLQQGKSKEQNTAINVKGNENTIIVLQYDLDKTADYQKFMVYLNNALKANKEAKEIMALTQRDAQLIKVLVAKSRDSGFFDPTKFLDEFDRLKIENDKYREKVARLIRLSQIPEYTRMLTKANQALARFDHKTYQSILRKYDEKITRQSAEISYLRAGDFRVTFKFDSALIIIDKALAIEPDNANYLTEKGDIYYQKGAFKNALENYQKALTIRKQKTGNAHPDAAKSYNNIGEVYINLGVLDSALVYFQKAILNVASATSSLDIANYYNNIGTVYNEIGEFDKALEYHEKGLRIEEKLLGKQNKDVAISYGNMALAFNNKREYSEAIAYLEKALAIQLKVLGTVHPDVATSYNNIGYVYQSTQEYEKAIENYHKALIIEEKLLGEGHLNTAIFYHNIGGAYIDKKVYDKAIEYYQKALKVRQDVLGETHLDVATTHTNIGLAYSKNGEQDKALEHYNISLLILDKLQVKDESGEATTYNNIGLAYDYTGDYDKALEYYQKALEIKERVLGKNHPSVLDLCKAIGMVYIAKGEKEKGKEWLNRAPFAKETDYDKSLLLYNEGMGAFQVKQYWATINFYEFALELLEASKTPQTDQLWVIFNNNLAKAYCYQGNKEKALLLFEKAIELGKNTSMSMARVISNYEECKNK